MAACTLLLPLVLAAGGCSLIPHLGTDLSGEPIAKTFYVGGAGPFGHIGTLDVPAGLRKGGYEGAIEVFGWQSMLGGTLRDHLDRERNEAQARRLARRIERYLDRFPGNPVNIIALSAGTGITTWALENLDEGYRVGTVVFLSSSLSRHYDLSAALRRVDGQIYTFYSAEDPVLRYGVSLTGSVDREFRGPNVAGLYGFALPLEADAQVRKLYARCLRNRPWRRAYARHGYRGLHTDSTVPSFVARFLAPLMQTSDGHPDAPNTPEAKHEPPAASQPTTHPRLPTTRPAKSRSARTRDPSPKR